NHGRYCGRYAQYRLMVVAERVVYPGDLLLSPLSIFSLLSLLFFHFSSFTSLLPVLTCGCAISLSERCKGAVKKNQGHAGGRLCSGASGTDEHPAGGCRYRSHRCCV